MTTSDRERIEQLTQALAEHQRDSARLDWLERQCRETGYVCLNGDVYEPMPEFFEVGELVFTPDGFAVDGTGSSIREAIDAAMEGTK